MSNELQNSNNIYLDLAKGSYPDESSVLRFPMECLTSKQQEKLISGNSLPFDFSKTIDGNPGGQAPGMTYKLYLQPAYQ